MSYASFTFANITRGYCTAANLLARYCTVHFVPFLCREYRTAAENILCVLPKHFMPCRRSWASRDMSFTTPSYHNARHLLTHSHQVSPHDKTWHLFWNGAAALSYWYHHTSSVQSTCTWVCGVSYDRMPFPPAHPHVHVGEQHIVCREALPARLLVVCVGEWCVVRHDTLPAHACFDTHKMTPDDNTSEGATMLTRRISRFMA